MIYLNLERIIDYININYLEVLLRLKDYKSNNKKTNFIKGHVAALRQILDPSFSGCKIYNLGTGKGHTVLEMIKAFSEVCSSFNP